MRPTNYPGGIGTQSAYHIFGDFQRPDPTQVVGVFDDFIGFTTAAAGVYGWHLDEVNTGTGPTLLDEFGGVVQNELDNAQGDNRHFQLALNTTVHEFMKLSLSKKAWLTYCFSIEDADQNLVQGGCHNAADDVLGTLPTDAFWFYTPTLGTLACALRTGSANVASITLGTLADGVRYACRAYYDGHGTLFAEAEIMSSGAPSGVFLGRGKASVASIPTTEMTLGFGAEANDTGADALQADWVGVWRER